MRKVISMIHGGLAWVILAAVIAQFFFAGLGIFRASSFQAHRTTGSLIMLASLLLLVLALAGWLGKVRIGLSALLLVLTIVQSLLVRGPSLVAALHPVNALLIMGVTATLARLGRESGAPARAGLRERRMSGERAA